jgi:hypothetical protein
LFGRSIHMLATINSDAINAGRRYDSIQDVPANGVF